jgi:DNA repair exonuclease SbcCD ATPase subunit
MKPIRLQITNIGAIAALDLPINKPLLLFYGDVRQGKTTILNAIRWCWGGAFPRDIIKQGAEAGSIQMDLDDKGVAVVIRREFYVGKDGVTKARDLVLTRNGVPQQRPTNHIALLLNPFLLNQNHLANMNERERGQYFVELFAIDTKKEDEQIAKAADEAQQLRSKIKGYGEIDLTKVEKIDVSQLQAQLAKVRADDTEASTKAQQEIDRLTAAHRAACDEITQENKDAGTVNAAIDAKERRAAELTEQIARAQVELAEIKKHLATTPRWPMTAMPDAPDITALQAKTRQRTDTSALEAAIMNAAAQNVHAEQYLANLARAKARDDDKARVSHLEEEQRLFKIARTARLADASATCGIPNMVFTDSGSFVWEGTDAGMLSTSQIMRLSQLLSSRYPEGFGLELIDRGESLGKSVLTLWKEAQERERTILVTVVGDKPATVPEQAGAYVMKEGVAS